MRQERMAGKARRCPRSGQPPARSPPRASRPAATPVTSRRSIGRSGPGLALVGRGQVQVDHRGLQKACPRTPKSAEWIRPPRAAASRRSDAAHACLPPSVAAPPVRPGADNFESNRRPSAPQPPPSRACKPGPSRQPRPVPGNTHRGVPVRAPVVRQLARHHLRHRRDS